MRFTTATTFLALAMSISALQSTKMTTATAKDQCTTGDIACCDSKEILSGDGVLGNLLAKGGLNGLLGNDDSASSTKDFETGPVCKNIIACCPKGTGDCTAIDSAE
ncbi:uncharacterized protein N7506_005482 [Penicillium brevicompactum]|uniref:uncharacterized protein n=1 Tax=Penicillium brevicompactum TaxID=5074 RepID=UPI00253F674E|nr:uncharacterized protein N7506_005482 [Penicillium brevicompactum]KAJ5337460.1 hypothetical protein N7506_005482 [Penicillium brevicompactum]